MLANRGLLVGGNLLPVPGHEAGGLDGGLLAKVGIVVGADDLDQEEEGLGLGVEVLLELGSDGLDPLRVGCFFVGIRKAFILKEAMTGFTYGSGSLGAG